MAYIEQDKLDALLAKLDNTCAENNLIFSFRNKSYPVRIVIAPDGSMDGQISMLDNPVGCNSKDASRAFVFVDGGIQEKTTGEFTLSDTLISKLKNMAKKIHYTWLQVFHRDTLDRDHLNDLADRAEPPEDYDQQQIDEALPDNVEDTADELAGMTLDEPDYDPGDDANDE